MQCPITACLYNPVIQAQCGNVVRAAKKLQTDGIIIIRIRHRDQCAHTVRRHIVELIHYDPIYGPNIRNV